MKTVTYPKIRSKSIFEQIIDHIQVQLANRNLKAGDQLPPERNLAEMMGVNRHSIREAFRVLEYLGVIERKVGIGTVIRSAGHDVLVDRVAHAADFSSNNFLFELLELRQAIEPAMASLASQRATDEEISEMENAILDLKTNPKSWGKADTILHLTIAKASHNTAFLKLSEPVLNILWQYMEKLKNIPSRRKSRMKEHEDIVKAIKNHDAKGAEKAMKHHLLQLSKALKNNQ
jgi:GntR family transcriptional repressor for pyruvate dehydrogenase complex